MILILCQSDLFENIEKIQPVIEPHGSDSADFDMALEMLYMTGRSLAHSIMMMIPKVCDNDFLRFRQIESEWIWTQYRSFRGG